MIILGSDEVFNLEHPLFDPIYYGVGLKTVCMTYAPSSGQCNEDMDITDEMKKSLMRMVSISARDMHTKSLIQHNVKKNVDLVDAYLWVRAKELGTIVFTFDKDFNKFN